MEYEQTDDGGVGLMARKVYDNFEVVLMFIVGYVIGAVVAPLTAVYYGLEVGAVVTLFVLIALVLLVIGTHIIDRDLFEFGLIDQVF